MGYRNHVTTAARVAVQEGSMAEIAAALGFEIDEGEASVRAVVLNDMGNQESFIIQGTPDDVMRLALNLAFTAHNAIDPTGNLRGALEEVLGDAYAYRIGDADPNVPGDLDDGDREALTRFRSLADRLGLVIPS